MKTSDSPLDLLPPPPAASRRSPAGWRGTLVVAGVLAALAPAAGQTLRFTDATRAAGLVYQHGYPEGVGDSWEKMAAGGVAAGDYDRDGYVDLFVVRGGRGPTLLFHNRGDGTFQELGAKAGLRLSGGLATAPTFGDYDGDGWLDLLEGGIDFSPPRLFRNRGDGTFVETTRAAGLVVERRNTFSSAFGDYDRDGDLDLFLAHWSQAEDCRAGECGKHLWRNNGDGTFTDVDAAAGIGAAYGSRDFSLTPNFADLDSDGLPDLVVTGDFGTSEVFHNLGGGTFERMTDPAVMTDENGAGAAVADVDNDGDLDWFVTSVSDPRFGKTGNRLYLNRGDGSLFDDSVAAEVRSGSWGWGACAADFDQDGHVDLFEVTGSGDLEFQADASRLYLNNGDGTFREALTEVGMAADRSQGRGVVCFDYDRDGDLDILVANNSGAGTLWRNDSIGLGRWLDVSLATPSRNRYGVGGRIYVTAGGQTQMRELRMGSNYASQDPTSAHFGLATAARVDELVVIWPEGVVSTHADLPVDRYLKVSELYGDPSSTTYTTPARFEFGGCSLCQVETSLEIDGAGNPAPARAALVGWGTAGSDRVSVVLEPDNDRLVFYQWYQGRAVNRVVYAAPLVERRVYDVKIGFDGSDFRVYLDGLPVLLTPNAAPVSPSGNVALLTQNARVTLHNLAVTAIALPNPR